MPAEISLTELKEYEGITPPYTIRPKIVHLRYDSKQKDQFVIFDTETTCTGKLAEMCQLSAVSGNGKHEFSTYILPKSYISYSAYLVNGMTIKNIKGVRTLCHCVGKTTKTSSSKQVILQMHSICFSFKDMTSVKVWRDEIKAAETLLFTPAVAKNGFVFWNCTGSQIRNHIRMAFSVFSIFISIISILFVPISLILSYFRLSIREILTASRRWATNHTHWFI